MTELIDKEEIGKEFERVDKRIDKLTKIISDYLQVGNDFAISSLKAALKSV